MKIIIIVLLFVPQISLSKDSLFQGIFPRKDDKVLYEIVVTVDSTSKNTLFSRAKNWAISEYNSQKDALQVDDKEGGMLAYKGYFTNLFEWPPRMGISPKEEWQYWETFKILFKENKVKISITDFKITDRPITYSSSSN